MTTRDLAKILIPTIIGLTLIVILVVAIYYPPTGKMTCTLSSAPGDPQAEYTYVVKFNLWKVHEIESKEVITSKNKNVLNTFKEAEEKAADNYKDLNYYTYDISLKGKKLTSVITIDYDKVDYSKLSSLEETKKNHKKALSINAVKKIYQENGAKCKYR